MLPVAILFSQVYSCRFSSSKIAAAFSRSCLGSTAFSQISASAAVTAFEGKAASFRRFAPWRGPYEHPVVLPHVSHFMQVPFLTKVKFPHSPQASPS
jgi:hypothetical protein